MHKINKKNTSIYKLLYSLLVICFFHLTLQSQETVDTKYVQFLVSKKYDEANHLKDSVCEINSSLNQYLCMILDGFSKVYPNYETDKAIKQFFEALQFAEDNQLNKKYHIHALLSIAETFYMLEDMDKCLIYYSKAEEISVMNDNYMFTAINYGFLATYTAKNDTSNIIKYQQKVISTLDNQLPNNRKKIWLIKFDYFHVLSKKDSVIFYGNKILDTSKNEYLNSMISMKVGDTYIQNQDTTRAIEMFSKAFEYSMNISHPESILLASDRLKAIYLNIDNIDQAKYYSKVSDSVKTFVINQTKYNGAIEAKEKYHWNKKVKTYKARTRLVIMVSIGLIIILLLTLFMFLKRRSKSKNKSSTKDPKLKDSLIIEEKLTPFINDHIYLNRNIDLTYLADKIDVKNKRSLSEYINQKYNKTFPSFINDLRFEYLTNHLLNEKNFDNLKVDEVAYRLGFGSTRSFQIFIKKKTGLAPSEFLSSLNQK